MKTEKYAAFIPVRGGSKSIPLKNIKPINGRPLVYWTIDAAVDCPYIDKVYVSTDSQAIKDTVDAYDRDPLHKLTCIDRDPATATDTASTESAMLDFAGKIEFGNIILMQATSPMLGSRQLSEAIEKYENEGFDSLLSVVRQKRFVWAESEDGGFVPQNYDYTDRPRRQDFDGYLVENGAFYITGRKRLMRSRCRISGKIGAYEMDEDTYFEIDEESDWIIVENLLRNKHESIAPEDMSKIKMFVTDCDGVMTDGGMYYTETGDEMKKFNTKDGMGFSLLKKAGIKTAIVTGEDTQIVADRARKLNVDFLYMGVKDKLTVLRELIDKAGISLDEVAYMGDDINDLECIKDAGFSISVPGAIERVKASADMVTDKKGGDGAVREAIDFILKYI